MISVSKHGHTQVGPRGLKEQQHSIKKNSSPLISWMFCFFVLAVIDLLDESISVQHQLTHSGDTVVVCCCMGSLSFSSLSITTMSFYSFIQRRSDNNEGYNAAVQWVSLFHMASPPPLSQGLLCKNNTTLILHTV